MTDIIGPAPELRACASARDFKLRIGEAICFDALPAPLAAAAVFAAGIHGERAAISFLCRALGAPDTPLVTPELAREIRRAIDADGVGWVAGHVRELAQPIRPQTNGRKW